MSRNKLVDVEPDKKSQQRLTKNKLLRMWAHAVDAYIPDDMFQHYSKEIFGEIDLSRLKDITYATIKSAAPAKTINELYRLCDEQTEDVIPKPRRKETRQDVINNELKDLGLTSMEDLISVNPALKLRDPQTGELFLVSEEMAVEND